MALGQPELSVLVNMAQQSILLLRSGPRVRDQNSVSSILEDLKVPGVQTLHPVCGASVFVRAVGLVLFVVLL